MSDAASQIQFDAELLLEEARKQTNLSNFGPEDFRGALDVLLRTYEANHTTAKGRDFLNRLQILDIPRCT